MDNNLFLGIQLMSGTQFTNWHSQTIIRYLRNKTKCSTKQSNITKLKLKRSQNKISFGFLGDFQSIDFFLFWLRLTSAFMYCNSRSVVVVCMRLMWRHSFVHSKSNWCFCLRRIHARYALGEIKHVTFVLSNWQHCMLCF